MKYIITCLVLLFTMPSFGQRIDGRAIEGDKIIASKSELNFEDGRGWLLRDSMQYRYDELDRLLEKRHYHVIDSNWVISYKEFYEYQDNKTTITGEDLRDGQWVTTFYHEKHYNDKELVTKSLSQFGYSGELRNDGQHLYTYDDKGNLIERIYQVWEEAQWLDYERTIFEYDDRDNLIYEKFESWKNNEWNTNIESIYEFDSLSVLKALERETGYLGIFEHVRYEYDSLPYQYIETRYNLRGSKEPERIEIIQYNAYNLPIIHKVELKESSFFTQIKIDSFYYNDAHLPIIKKSQTVENDVLVYVETDSFFYKETNEIISYKNNSWSEEWVRTWEEDYSYDAQSNLIAITPTLGFVSYEFEYNGNNELVKKIKTSPGIIETPPYDALFRDIYYYENSLTTSLFSVQAPPKLSLEVYPNPTQQELFITSDDVKEEIVNYKIVNQFGQLVLAGLVGSKNTSIKMEKLPVGSYWIVFEDSTKRKVAKKIVKQ